MKETDLKTLASKGISEEQIKAQLEAFRTGFPFLNIEKAAAIGDGIVRYTEPEQEEYLKEWEDYLGEGHRVVKFVPASGAASRMFKNLFEFLNQPYNLPKSDFEVKFFSNLKKFAFYEDLNEVCKKNEGKDIETLTKEGEYKTVARNLLEEEGLNYGNLPKGLLKFHAYADGNRTPVEEHLVEGALYAASDGKVNLHFTVSADHRELFEQKVREVKDVYATRYGVRYDVSFSEQKASTDTIAADMENEPFRDEKGGLVFRPGGHGALIENLNDIDGDVIFIKNIDNVVPDRYKGDTVRYKQLIAGVLVSAQRKAFAALEKLNSGDVSEKDIEEISDFCEKTLNNKQGARLPREEQIAYLRGKLDRPIRVCGMVKNEGEPGGGPYLIVNKDGSVSPQDTGVVADRHEGRALDDDHEDRHALQPSGPGVRNEELPRRVVRPAEIRRSGDGLHLAEVEIRPGLESPGTSRPVERRNERLEHIVCRGAGQHVQSRENGERPATRTASVSTPKRG